MARNIPTGGFPSAAGPKPEDGAPVVAICSPHPDDECIVGALALRLRREAGYRVVNVAVTLGSLKDRQAGRLDELSAACGYLGFNLVCAGGRGLDGINSATRGNDPAGWRRAVDVLAGIFSDVKPAVVLVPHFGDRHPTHVGTHLLAIDALSALPRRFSCIVAESEYWQPMASPNIMVEVSDVDASDIVAAISFHRGEVSRNPYHVGLPSWMHDNVRRGSEIVGSAGGQAPDFTFAVLYRLRKWGDQGMKDDLFQGRMLSAKENAGALLG